MGGLEAAQQLVQRVQHLLGELLARPRSGTRGCRRAARRAARSRGRVSSRGCAEQQPQRGADRPACGLDHVGDLELEPARALAARRRDQPQRAAVEEQPGWDGGLAQQPLHRVRASMASSLSAARWLVEVARRGRARGRAAATAARRRPGSSSRTARSGRERDRRSRAAATSSSSGIGVAVRAPAYPFGEKLQPSTSRANASKSAIAGVGSRPAPSGAPRRTLASSRCPSASRRSRIAPARTSAGAETTRPVGWTKPSHSRWSRTLRDRRVGHLQFVSGHR